MAVDPISDGGDPQVRVAAAYTHELFEAHARMVYGLCRALLRDPDDADDATQGTFIAAYRSLLGGNRVRDAGAWLATIARNECTARARARMREPLPLLETDLSHADGPEAELERQALVAELQQAIAMLPEKQREAVVLRDLYGLHYTEVGAALGISVASVESLLFRARRNLRVSLKPLAGGALAVPVAVREGIAQALPALSGTGAGGGATSGAIGLGLLAKIAGGPAAMKAAAGVAAAVTAGSIAVAGVEHRATHGIAGSSDPRPAAVTRAAAPVQDDAVAAQGGAESTTDVSDASASHRGGDDGTGDTSGVDDRSGPWSGSSASSGDHESAGSSGTSDSSSSSPRSGHSDRSGGPSGPGGGRRRRAAAPMARRRRPRRATIRAPEGLRAPFLAAATARQSPRTTLARAAGTTPAGRARRAAWSPKTRAPEAATRTRPPRARTKTDTAATAEATTTAVTRATTGPTAGTAATPPHLLPDRTQPPGSGAAGNLPLPCERGRRGDRVAPGNQRARRRDGQSASITITARPPCPDGPATPRAAIVADPVEQLTAALSEAAGAPVTLDRPADPTHGDYATNVALQLAGRARRPPREIAEEIVLAAAAVDGVAQATVAGPGFVNLELADTWFTQALSTVLAAGVEFGGGSAAVPERVQVEMVSANPTGPMTVAAARNGAYGDCVARLLSFAGHMVEREYYYNDAGAQMDRFRASVDAVRRGEEPPEDGYHGDYIAELAKIDGDPVPVMLGLIEAALDGSGSASTRSSARASSRPRCRRQSRCWTRTRTTARYGREPPPTVTRRIACSGARTERPPTSRPMPPMCAASTRRASTTCSTSSAPTITATSAGCRRWPRCSAIRASRSRC